MIQILKPIATHVAKHGAKYATAAFAAITTAVGTKIGYNKGHAKGKREGTIAQAERDARIIAEMKRNHDKDRKLWHRLRKQYEDLLDAME